jgi:hypothetical protein
MRNIGLLLCIVGAVVTAIGAMLLYGDGGAIGIGDWAKGVIVILIGLSLGAIGALLYLVDFLITVFRYRESFNIYFNFRLLWYEIYQELGYPIDEDLQYEDVEAYK